MRRFFRRTQFLSQNALSSKGHSTLKRIINLKLKDAIGIKGRHLNKVAFILIKINKSFYGMREAPLGLTINADEVRRTRTDLGRAAPTKA